MSRSTISLVVAATLLKVRFQIGVGIDGVASEPVAVGLGHARACPAGPRAAGPRRPAQQGADGVLGWAAHGQAAGGHQRARSSSASLSCGRGLSLSSAAAAARAALVSRRWPGTHRYAAHGRGSSTCRRGGRLAAWAGARRRRRVAPGALSTGAHPGQRHRLAPARRIMPPVRSRWSIRRASSRLISGPRPPSPAARPTVRGGPSTTVCGSAAGARAKSRPATRSMLAATTPTAALAVAPGGSAGAGGRCAAMREQ